MAACLALPLCAGSKLTERGKPVDNGSFGIYVGGHRVGTEQFRIDQLPNGDSITASEISVTDGQVSAVQSSELELSPKGELIRYSWQEQSPGKAQSTVEPSDSFLMQHTTDAPNGKALNQKYLLPASTLILEDYFFVHREILVWRYLATTCAASGGGLQCKSAPGQFPVLVPRQQTSASVAIEFRGADEVTSNGGTRRLMHYLLRTASGDPNGAGVPDTVDWHMWLDSDKKLVRVAAAGMEVVRD